MNIPVHDYARAVTRVEVPAIPGPGPEVGLFDVRQKGVSVLG